MNNNPSRIGYCPGESTQNNVISFLQKQAREYPDKDVFLWPEPGGGASEHSITFEGLYRNVSALTHSLTKLGLTSGDRTLVFLPMSHTLYATVFAVQMSGGAAVFLDSWARTEELAHVLKISEPRAVVSTPLVCENLKKLPTYESTTIEIHLLAESEMPTGEAHSLSQLLDTHEEGSCTPVESEHTALITFTTGSSGAPKGADRTHRFLASQHYALREAIPHTSEDRDLTAFPIFALNNIAGGVTTVLPAIDLSKPTSEDGRLLMDQLITDRASCATLSPSMLRNLLTALENDNTALPGLRRLVTGGAPISCDDARRLSNCCPHTEFVILYGSTEVEPIAEITGSRMLAEAEKTEHSTQGVNVGTIHPALSYRFIPIGLPPQQRGVDLPSLCVNKGEVGELIVSGEHVCRGYIGDEDAFRRSKIEDKDNRVWHRTGDLGRVDDAGDLYLVGRVHSAFQRAGKWLFPVSAEVLLKRIPGVLQAAYFAVPSPDGDNTAVAAVQVDPQVNLQKLAGTVHSQFSTSTLPLDQLVLVKKMPLDPRHHSKVQYDQLREMISSGNYQELE